MKRMALGPAALLVALGYSASTTAPLALVGTAFAQSADREQKEERKVLKLSDVATENRGEAYRQAARVKRHEAMAFLEDILANRAPQGEQKAEMMLRLADLYFEEGRDYYLSEMQKFEKEYDACFNQKGCNAETMKADNSESRKWQNKSIKLYKLILQNYPQYARADEATFYLANALSDIGERDQAIDQYTQLVRTYPESKYIPDSYIQIGEYYFDNNNAYKALLAYQKAARYKDSDKYGFAMYKLAWCYYNVGEYGKSIDTMKSVVAYSTPVAGASEDKGKMSLQDEALKDLVRFFADAGEMDEAYAYFNKLGKKDLIRQMLKRLASTYFEQGKFEQCIQTYRRLIAENPQATEAPEYQNEIILAYQKTGQKQETLAEIDRLLKTYGKNSAWARTNSSSPDSVKAANDYIEKNLRTVAINYHNEAKKLGTGAAAKETYALAYKAYSVYLEEFPDSKYSYDVRYAFGELLYKIKKFDEAYAQYMKVVSIDPKGQHSKFCAESAIFAAEEMVKVEEKSGQGAAKGAKTEAVALSDWNKKLLEACDQFAKLFPDDTKTRNVIYKSAYLLYNHNQFKEASDRFRVVISKDPASKEAEQAANLILDSFNLVEDWNNLKDVSKAFYDQQGLGSKSFKTEVYNVYERASFKVIEVNLSKSKDEVAAAAAYRAFYTEFPNSEVADLALNNASVYFHKQGKVAKAMEVRHILVEKYPKSKYYKSQVASLGFDYESIADFDDAASWYEKLFSLDKDHEGSKDAIYSAALFRTALGQWEQGIKNYQQFMTAYPTDDKVTAITLDIAKLYEENKKWAEASKIYLAFFSKPPANASIDEVFFARLRYGLDLEQLGETAKAEKHWKETLAAYDAVKAKGGEMELAPEFIAQIMFKQAKEQIDRYMALKVDGPKSKVSAAQETKILKDQLVGKAKALQDVEKTFTNIIGTGAGEWGLAGLVALGKAYENMAAALRESYIPPNLNADQKEFYKMGLEDRAFPQVEKAVEAYNTAVQKSFELSLYNENTAYAIRRLGELRPATYPQLEETLLEAKYTAGDRSGIQFEEQP
jgi:cellulose synthase operon protein C